MQQVIQIEVPKLYSKQLEIYENVAKRKVIASGRRTGKTLFAAYLATEIFMQGKRVLISSTTQDQSNLFWDYLIGKRKDWKWFFPAIKSGWIKKNETTKTIESQFHSGRIRIKTGREPNVLRGEDADLIIFDECVWLDEEVWSTVGSPMLADNDGSAVFLSSPSRKNWFYYLYLKAKSEDNTDWFAWNFPSFANPYLSKKALVRLADDMTDASYKQEILAIFPDDENSVFSNVKKAAKYQKSEPYEGNFVMGLDWAQANDYTVATVLDVEKRKMVDMERFNGVAWKMQSERVEKIARKWKVQKIVAEKNSMGSPMLEALQDRKLPVEPFITTAHSKPPLIESLVLAFEKEEIEILNDPILIGELQAFEKKINKLNLPSYSAPSNMHDDCVMSLAFAWHGVNRPDLTKYFLV